MRKQIELDAIGELVKRSKKTRGLRAFYRFDKPHPEVLDFLVAEIRARLDRGYAAFSYSSLWQYARWKLELEKGPGDTYQMNDHAETFYARAITILHPDFNGRCEFRKSKADDAFGLRIEPAPAKRSKHHAVAMEGWDRARTRLASDGAART
jgi:hypothetical protein